MHHWSTGGTVEEYKQKFVEIMTLWTPLFMYICLSLHHCSCICVVNVWFLEALKCYSLLLTCFSQLAICLYCGTHCPSVVSCLQDEADVEDDMTIREVRRPASHTQQMHTTYIHTGKPNLHIKSPVILACCYHVMYAEVYSSSQFGFKSFDSITSRLNVMIDS